MSIIRKVFTILLGVTLMFMNISGVKAQDDNTTTDFSNYITAASLDYKEGDKEIAYTADAKLTEDTPLVFKLDADVPSSALSSDHKIDYQLPDNLNVDDTTSDHIYLKDDLTKSVGNYTIADHHMVIDLSALDYGVDSSKSIELDLETTTSHLIFTDSEAKIYFRKATNESPTEVMVSVLQSYANDTKADPNSIIKNTNTYTNTKKSYKQVITMAGVKRANSNVKARKDQTINGAEVKELSGNLAESQDNNNYLSYGIPLIISLTGDAYVRNDINIDIQSNITIKLNGHNLFLLGTGNKATFINVTNKGSLTIEDSGTRDKSSFDTNTEVNDINDIDHHLSSISKVSGYDEVQKPTSLTYYVTESQANGTSTTETTYRHDVNLQNIGKICAKTSSIGNNDAAILVRKGGKLNIKGGAIFNEGSHVIATDGNDTGNADVKIEDGYIIGDKRGSVIFNNAGNTLTMSGGVITNGRAENGGGIYNNGTENGGTGGGTIDLSGGVISGNEAVNDGDNSTSNRYSGGGIYMKSGTLNISEKAYITNNRKSEGTSVQDHFSVHGGGGVAADNDTQMN
ncbi:hypothetical protein, partial [Intestinibaculum porci]|uniref:hypothetical protein n=1 Tax=Intestinibaculum porci TaxID=2487118 RepID=UPI0024096323